MRKTMRLVAQLSHPSGFVELSAPLGSWRGSAVVPWPDLAYSRLNGRKPIAVPPETKYARSGDINIAYQVIGDAPIDLVYVAGWVSHLDYFWEEPSYARFLRRLASFARLILLDKRGTGLSDRVAELPTIEERMDDVRAVLDGVGSERAALVGLSEGGPLCALFAATYPERTSALVMIGSYARRLWALDYPWGTTIEESQSFLDQIERGWGGPVALARRAPSRATDERFRQWWATYLRMSASPGAALALTRMNFEIDIRHVLPAIRVPTLILHRTNDMAMRVEGSRYMAERIAGARYVELPGPDHLPFVGDQDAILDEIEGFLTGVRHGGELDTVLATVLVAEIAGSAKRATEAGDGRPQELLDAWQTTVREQLARFRGRQVELAEGRLLATFDGTVRAVRCACAISTAVQGLGLQVKAGVHTGECHLVGDRVEGFAVDTGAQIAALALAGEVLASSTVKDLVAGSGIQFEDRGTSSLKGGPEGGRDGWRLFRIVQSPGPAAVPRTVTDAIARRSAGPLSQREQEVATLVSLGLSNRQIAEDLVIAESTAERHVANILNKLGYHSRAQIAAWAVEQARAQGRR
ncbi:MAG TPA: alpha/beta fold hydrolase [Chloroflexota bacterium]|nr:alpha/beta fold hydrolase [Chloroflexota bacterium]